ncbi:MAG: TolC family protein [Candidatus Rokubacteria bacterium]|nr:TolC family protein [Candidatus Rokubacteria bacterium]
MRRLRTRRAKQGPFFSLLLGILLWAVPGHAQAPAVQRELSLDEVIDLALAKNAGLRAAEREVEAALKGHEAARGRLWPFADVFGDWQYSGPNEENKTRLLANIGRMPKLGPTLADNQPIGGVGRREFDHNLYALGLRVTYPLYVGGRIVAEIEANRLVTLLTRERLAQTADELIFNLSSTFYNLLRLRENVGATEANVRALEEARKNIGSLVEVGRAPRVDLFKVNTRLAAVRQELTRARNEVELAHAVLKTLMGLDVTEPLTVKGTLGTEAIPLDLGQDLRESERRRPELQARRRTVEVREQQVRIARGARLPSVSVRTQYLGGAGESEFGQPVGDFVVGVNVSVPLFTGGELTARIAQEEAKLARAREALEKARLDIQLDVQAAHLQTTEARERIATAQAALEEAREALRIEQLKMEVGKGIVEDLLDAQAAELQAETNHTRALADYNTALVARKKAIGRIR